MDTGEGPGEKQAALAEFLSAMLPASSSQSLQQDLSQNAAHSRSEGRGNCRQSKEGSAKEQKVTWMVKDIWGAWIDWGRALVQGEQVGGVEDKEEDFGAWLNARMWALGLDSEVCAPYVAGLLELEEVGPLYLQPCLVICLSSHFDSHPSIFSVLFSISFGSFSGVS
jgi:hypothetical protein